MTTISKLVILFLVLFSSLFISCTNDDDSNEQQITEIKTSEDLTNYLRVLSDTYQIPGLSVTVAYGNSIEYQKSIGYANIENQLPYTNQTLNSIASVSKTFVGAATAKAIALGYFNLDTNINDLLPIDIINPKQPDSEIKIKHLVTHTSGIVEVPSIYLSTNYFILPGENIATVTGDIMINSIGIEQMDQIDLDEYLFEIFNEDGELYSLDNYLDAAAGEQWMYSNNATSLMSFIIENVSGQSFDDFVAQHILSPLQMTNSTYDINELDFSNMATAYLDLNNSFPRYANHGYAEGGMNSTNEDLGNYLLDMMKGARGEGSALFSQTYYDILFQPQLDFGIVPSDFADNHGLFWYMKDGNLMHGGNSFGVSTHIQLKENGSSGFFIQTNMDATFTSSGDNWEQAKNLITQAINEFLSNN